MPSLRVLSVRAALVATLALAALPAGGWKWG
jgi:hypothetical protein